MDIMGASCFVGTLHEAADAVVARACSGEGGYVVQCNVHLLMTAQGDGDVMTALRGASFVMPDGAPIAWLQRRRGATRANRIGGPDLMPLVISRGRQHRLRHFFLGSTTTVLAALTTRLRAAYPGLHVAGTFAPPVSDIDGLDAAAAVVADKAADVVWVAFGAPKQELWLSRNSASLGAALAVGVGAAFDFHSGAKARAPEWMRRAGLEWAHRLMSEPGRLAGRYAATNTAFAARALGEIRGRGGTT